MKFKKFEIENFNIFRIFKYFQIFFNIMRGKFQDF